MPFTNGSFKSEHLFALTVTPNTVLLPVLWPLALVELEISVGAVLILPASFVLKLMTVPSGIAFWALFSRTHKVSFWLAPHCKRMLRIPVWILSKGLEFVTVFINGI